MLLPFAIHVFHTLVVLFIVLAPFLTNIPSYLILHITSCFSLLVHWWGNSDVCSLTVMEAQLRGVSREEALTHKFIAPVYNIGDNTWNQLLYAVTIILMLTSVYKLQNNSICAKVYNDLMNVSDDITGSELKTRLQHYMRICQPLFMV